MIKEFSNLGLKPELVTGLLAQEITVPTDIQSLCIQEILDKKDIIASSKTGSGKTLAYLLPIMTMLNDAERHVQAIVLAPTHELCVQVYKQIELLVQNAELKNIRAAVLIGGANINRQMDRLKEKPQIVVGTTGRILELIRLKKLTTHFVKTIVLDEADRMFDVKNIESVKAIVKTTLKERQIIMFSATIDSETKLRAEELLKNPSVIVANKLSDLPQNIEHIYFECEKRDKIEVLKKLFYAENITRGIVFLNNNEDIENLSKRLNYHSIKSAPLFGETLKNERRNILNDFKDGRINLLIASDIVARGLDIKDLSHIININVPESSDLYLHRAGRAGRAGEHAIVATIAEPSEVRYLKKFSSFFKINIAKKVISQGEVAEPKKVEKNNKK